MLRHNKQDITAIAAATDWFDPLPPGPKTNDVPRIVSPILG
jgi:hypothetical protein